VDQAKKPRGETAGTAERRPRPSPLARRIIAFVGRICQPTAPRWKHQLARYLAHEFGGPLAPGEPITRDMWNVMKREIRLLCNAVFGRGTRHQAPRRLSSIHNPGNPSSSVGRPKKEK
jgi:hypothetical protein